MHKRRMSSMADKLTLNMYDNDIVKWEYDGKLYCLHVQRDETPMNPRRDWDNPITLMACWHRRYSLGDEIQDKYPEEFWIRMVRENVPESEILAAAESGKLSGIRIAKCRGKGKKGLVDVYETCQWRTVIGNSELQECLEYAEIARDTAAAYLIDDLTIEHCMTLMRPYAEWLPLWLYDHSGLTMSCGARCGQYADRWDSGQAGWIFVLKKTIMEECGSEYVLDENGERIKVEYPHKGAASTWGYLTRPLTDETWRKRAVEFMKADVGVYDQYLTGDVYGFTLYSAEYPEEGEDPAWFEEDSCWGFFGCDIMENGVEDHVGCGLRKAVEDAKIKRSEAIPHTSTYYTF